MLDSNIADARKIWVDPEISTLQLNETMGPKSGRGGDPHPYVDCTKS